MNKSCLRYKWVMSRMIAVGKKPGRCLHQRLFKCHHPQIGGCCAPSPGVCFTNPISYLSSTNSMSHLQITNSMSHLHITNLRSHSNSTISNSHLYVTNSMNHLHITNIDSFKYHRSIATVHSNFHELNESSKERPRTQWVIYRSRTQWVIYISRTQWVIYISPVNGYFAPSLGVHLKRVISPV